jgi:hypothetical protein
MNSPSTVHGIPAPALIFFAANKTLHLVGFDLDILPLAKIHQAAEFSAALPQARHRLPGKVKEDSLNGGTQSLSD